MNKSGEVEIQEEMDSFRPHQSIGTNPSADRVIVLKMIDELVMAGLGVLEEVPGLGPRFLNLRSGAVFWLGAHEITRIK